MKKSYEAEIEGNQQLQKLLAEKEESLAQQFDITNRINKGYISIALMDRF